MWRRCSLRRGKREGDPHMHVNMDTLMDRFSLHTKSYKMWTQILTFFPPRPPAPIYFLVLNLACHHCISKNIPFLFSPHLQHTIRHFLASPMTALRLNISSSYSSPRPPLFFIHALPVRPPTTTTTMPKQLEVCRRNIPHPFCSFPPARSLDSESSSGSGSGSTAAVKKSSTCGLMQRDRRSAWKISLHP